MNFILENLHIIVFIYILITVILFGKIAQQMKDINEELYEEIGRNNERILSNLDLLKKFNSEKGTLELSVSHLEKQVEELQKKNTLQEMIENQPTMSEIVMGKLKNNTEGYTLQEIHKAVEEVRGKALMHSVRSVLFHLEQTKRVTKISPGYGNGKIIWRINNEIKKK